MPYGTPELDLETRVLAEEIVGAIINAEATYQQADNALAEAQRIIMTRTKPTLSD